MNKVLYNKARYPLYLALLSLLLMIIILFVKIKWLALTGLVSSFIISIISVVYGIINLRYINRNDAVFRGESMSWISICLGVIAMLSTLPFVVAWIFSL